MKYILAALILLQPMVLCWALTDIEKREVVKQLIQPFEQDRIFYRSEAGFSNAEAMVATGKLQNNIFAENRVAGRIDSSFAFAAEGSSPTLLEIKVQRGSPMIDLTDARTLQILRAKGLSAEDVLKLRPQATVRFFDYRDWWYAFDHEAPTVRRFTGEGVASAELVRLYHSFDPLHFDSVEAFREAAQPVLRERLKTEPTLIQSLPYEFRVEKVTNAKSAREIINLMQVPASMSQTMISDSDKALETIRHEFLKRKPTSLEFVQFARTPMGVAQMKEYASEVIYQKLPSDYLVMLLDNMRTQTQTRGHSVGYEAVLKHIAPDLKNMNLTEKQAQEISRGISSARVKLDIYNKWPESKIYLTPKQCLDDVFRLMLLW